LGERIAAAAVNGSAKHERTVSRFT